MRKKPYSIALTNPGSKTLAMLGIRVIVKLGGVTHQVKPENRSGGKKKARPERYNLIA